MTSRPAFSLALAHWWHSLWLGVLWLPLLGIIALFLFKQDDVRLVWQSPGWGLLSLGLQAVVYGLGSLLWGSIFLGIPAAVVGLLRLPLMSWLLGRARQLPAHEAYPVVLGGTALVFEGSVALCAVLGAWLGKGTTLPWAGPPALWAGRLAQAVPGIFGYFALASLPWLLSSLVASYRIMQQEVEPPR